MDFRFDDTVPWTAPLGLSGFGPGRNDPGAVRRGGRRRAVRGIRAAVVVVAAVVLAVAGRLM
jgi:hypothetical protein